MNRYLKYMCMLIVAALITLNIPAYAVIDVDAYADNSESSATVHVESYFLGESEITFEFSEGSSGEAYLRFDSCESGECAFRELISIQPGTVTVPFSVPSMKYEISLEDANGGSTLWSAYDSYYKLSDCFRLEKKLGKWIVYGERAEGMPWNLQIVFYGDDNAVLDAGQMDFAMNGTDAVAYNGYMSHDTVVTAVAKYYDPQDESSEVTYTIGSFELGSVYESNDNNISCSYYETEQRVSIYGYDNYNSTQLKLSLRDDSRCELWEENLYLEQGEKLDRDVDMTPYPDGTYYVCLDGAPIYTFEHKTSVCVSDVKVWTEGIRLNVTGRSDKSGYMTLYFIPVSGGSTEKLTFSVDNGEFSYDDFVPQSLNGKYYVSTSEDQNDRESICGMLEWHSPAYDISGIKQTVKNGILTVTGTVSGGTDVHMSLYDENSKRIYRTVFYTDDGNINKSFYVGNVGDGETGKYRVWTNYVTYDYTLYTAENDINSPHNLDVSVSDGGEVHISGEISPVDDTEKGEFAAQLEDYKGNVIAVSGDAGGRITGQLFSEGKLDITANLGGLEPGIYCVTAGGIEFRRIEIPDFFTVRARAEIRSDGIYVSDLPNKFINVTQRDFRGVGSEYTYKTEDDGTCVIDIKNPANGAQYNISIGGSEESMPLYAKNVSDFGLFKIYRTADDILRIKLKPLTSGYMGLYGRSGDEYTTIREGYIDAGNVYAYETPAWGAGDILHDDSICFAFTADNEDINRLNSLFDAILGGNNDTAAEILNELADSGYFPKLGEVGAKRLAPYLISGKNIGVEEINAVIGALMISDAGGFSSDEEPYDYLFDSAKDVQQEIFNDFGEKYLSGTCAELKTTVADVRADICEQLLLNAIAGSKFDETDKILAKYAAYIHCERYLACSSEVRWKICKAAEGKKFQTVAELRTFIENIYKENQKPSGGSGGGGSSGGGLGLDWQFCQRLKYEITDGKATITGITPNDSGANDSSIAIPEELGGAPVVKIASGAFTEIGELTNIALPKTLETVENNAFGSLDVLNNIWIYCDNTDILNVFSDALSRETEPAVLHCAADSAVFAAAQNAEYSVSAFNNCVFHAEFADGTAEVWLENDNATFMPTGKLYVADDGGQVISEYDIGANLEKTVTAIDIPQDSELYFTLDNFAYKMQTNENRDIDIPLYDVYAKEYSIGNSECIFDWENSVAAIVITPADDNLFGDIVSVFAVWENTETAEKYVSLTETACKESAEVRAPKNIVSGEYTVRFSNGCMQSLKIRDKNDLTAALDSLNKCEAWSGVAGILETMGIFDDNRIQKMHNYLSDQYRNQIYIKVFTKCPYESCFSVYDTVNEVIETVTASSSAYGAELACGYVVEKYLEDNGYSLTDEQKSSLYTDIAAKQYTSRETLYRAVRSAVLSMQQFTVTFYDAFGEIIAQKTVNGGNSADASDVQTANEVLLKDSEGKNRSHIFKEWDKDLSCITSDTEVNPIYIPVYNAVFVTDGVPDIVGFADNKLLREEPAVREKFGYTGHWEEYSLGSADVVINAVYEPIIYTLRFIADGKEISTQQFTVENRGYTVPEVPEKEGCIGYFEEFEITDDFIRNGNFDIEARYLSTQCELISVNGNKPENGIVKIGDCGTDKIRLDIKVSDKAKYSVNGSDNDEVSLDYGENIISVAVTAEHGESKEYTVYVKRLFDEHKIISAQGGTVDGDTVDFGSVSSDTDIFVPIFTVSVGASYKIYSDEQMQNETEQIKLVSGKNAAYIKVTAENGEYSVYKITVTKRERLKPVMSSRGSGVYLPQKGLIELTSEADNARIYYTTDGTVPTEESMLYTSPIDFDTDMTLTAIAVSEGYDTSVAQVFIYKTCQPFENVHVSQVFGTGAVISFNKISQPEKFCVYMIENGNKTQITDITVSEDADRILVAGLKADSDMRFEIEAVYGNGSITAMTESIRTETEITDDCGILGISDPNARIDAENNTITGIIVPNKSESITISVDVKSGAQYGFYLSSSSKKQFADNIIPLREGKNTVYLKITASNKVTQVIYRVEIYRKTKSRMPQITITGNTAVISAADNAAVYYTTDGTVPNSVTGILYTQPFEIDANMIIRAIAAETDKDEVSDECIVRPRSSSVPYIIDIIDFEESADTVTYNINIVAQDAERQDNGIIIFAEYDGGGKFVKMLSEKIDLSADERYITKSVRKDNPENNIKIFLWNVFKDMLPLAESK